MHLFWAGNQNHVPLKLRTLYMCVRVRASGYCFSILGRTCPVRGFSDYRFDYIHDFFLDHNFHILANWLLFLQASSKLNGFLNSSVFLFSPGDALGNKSNRIPFSFAFCLNTSVSSFRFSLFLYLGYITSSMKSLCVFLSTNYLYIFTRSAHHL